MGVDDPLAVISAMMNERSDAAYCKGMIRTGSRSFFLASLFLPQPLRQATYALYAFCRQADDAIDDGADPDAELAIFQARLEVIYSGAVPDNAVDRALARVVRRYSMPRELLEALLQGFAWDTRARAYKDLAGVHCYSVRVAGSVGIATALLMGVREPNQLARAADLGVAMQLTNIARDVGEDARNGRVYLPRRWLRDEGLSASELIANPVYQPAVGVVVRRLLAAADQLYRRADSGIAGLPARCRPGIRAARLLYAGIGDVVLRNGGDSMSQRAVVSPLRKSQLLAQSFVVPAAVEEDLLAPPLPQVRYLLRAVDLLPEPEVAHSAGAASKGWRQDVDWVLEIFAELERRERDLYGPALIASAASERAGESAPSAVRSA